MRGKRRRYPFCKVVRLLSPTGEHPPFYPMYMTLHVGDTFLNCKVAFLSPQSPCITVPGTKFSVERYVVTETEELKNNICITLRFSSGSREYYVYPKSVWEVLEHRFIEPLSKGLPPREQGAILYGAPGVGKTSAVMILSDSLGLYTVNIEPETVLSKWVGESERNISDKMREAEECEPSVVVFDDAEWLLQSRNLAGSSADHNTYLGMLRVVFKKLQEWSRSMRRIISITTTNVSIEKLDPALKRSGRMGRPIFVPLPDYEAVYTLMVKLGVDPKTAEKWAIKIVNAGLPMSDVVSITRDLLDGYKPKVEPIKGRGYVRAIPPTDLPYRVLESIENRCKTTYFCWLLRRRSRIWFSETYTISIPVATTLVGLICNKPVVVMNDPRFVDEAVATAEASSGVLIVNTDLLTDTEICKLVSAISNVPVIYAGSATPPIPTIRASSRLFMGEREMFYVVSMFYGIAVKKEHVEEIMKLREEKRKSILKNMAFLSGDVDSEEKLTLLDVKKILVPYG